MLLILTRQIFIVYISPAWEGTYTSQQSWLWKGPSRNSNLYTNCGVISNAQFGRLATLRLHHLFTDFAQHLRQSIKDIFSILFIVAKFNTGSR